MLKSKKKEDVPKLVQVSRAPRGKKKSVTVVSGLSTFGKLFILKFVTSQQVISYFFSITGSCFNYHLTVVIPIIC